MVLSLIRETQLLQSSRMDDMSACSEDNTESLTKLCLCFFTCKQGFYTMLFFFSVLFHEDNGFLYTIFNSVTIKLMPLKCPYCAILTIQCQKTLTFPHNAHCSIIYFLTVSEMVHSSFHFL